MNKCILWALTSFLAVTFPVAKVDAQVTSPDQLSKQISEIQQQVRALSAQAEKSTKMAVPQAIHFQLEELAKFIFQLKALYGIYGEDDRRNYYRVDDNEQLAARATLALVRTSELTETGEGVYSLPATGASLCTPAQIDKINAEKGTKYQEEAFYEEPAPAFCSGVKIKDDIVATAGHCVKSNDDCKTISFVTGFFKTARGSTPHLGIASSRIFRCKDLIDRKHDPATKSDWALVRVDRKMNGVPQVKLASHGKIKTDDLVTVVGYPMGLPVKITGNAKVRRLEKAYFVTNLDTYGGNSGSPVLNSSELLKRQLVLEGLLVRGEADFAVKHPCRISKRCDEDGCRGEDVTFTNEFKAKLP
jgi:hypothetical protein